LLQKGFLGAPKKGGAWYTADYAPGFYSALLGAFVYKLIVRGMACYEKRDKENLSPFYFEKDYYNNE
jgi:hypothetical protein